jgi:hypothetical protein
MHPESDPDLPAPDLGGSRPLTLPARVEPDERVALPTWKTHDAVSKLDEYVGVSRR